MELESQNRSHQRHQNQGCQITFGISAHISAESPCFPNANKPISESKSREEHRPLGSMPRAMKELVSECRRLGRRNGREKLRPGSPMRSAAPEPSRPKLRKRRKLIDGMRLESFSACFAVRLAVKVDNTASTRKIASNARVFSSSTFAHTVLNCPKFPRACWHLKVNWSFAVHASRARKTAFIPVMRAKGNSARIVRRKRSNGAAKDIMINPKKVMMHVTSSVMIVTTTRRNLFSGAPRDSACGRFHPVWRVITVTAVPLPGSRLSQSRRRSLRIVPWMSTSSYHLRRWSAACVTLPKSPRS